jgi:iron complex outermembrane recepter protein
MLVSVRSLMRIMLLSCVLGTSIPADAEDAGTKTAEFHIGASELADALTQFGAQSGLQVVYSPDVARGLKSAALSGRVTVEAALTQMLKGSGITWTYLNGDTVVLKRAEVKKEATRAIQDDAGSNRPAPEFTDELTEITVSAQKQGEERLQEVPVPVSVLDAEKLASGSQVLLRDYYSSVPGFSVAPNIETTQMLAIRGVTTGNFSIPTVGVMIDDVPYGGSTNSGAGNNVPDLDPGDLARIEVLRGPQGTLYGANSMGGVIKYVTKDPSLDEYSGRIEAGTSSVHGGAEAGFNFRASGNIPLSDTMAIRVSGFRRHDPGYIDNPMLNREGVNAADADGVRVAALWQPAEDFSVKASAIYQSISAKGLSEVVVDEGLGELQQNYVAGADRYDVVNQAYSVVLNAKVGGIDVTSASGYSINQSTTPFDFTFAFGQAFQGLYGVSGAPFITRIDLHKFSQELRFSGHIGERLDWMGGGFFTREYETEANQVLYAVDAMTGRGDEVFWYRGIPMSFREYAGYMNLTYRVSDRFDVQMGLRQSHSEETDNQIQSGPYVTTALGLAAPDIRTGTSTGSALTYLLTPRFKVSADLMVYARLASGYRPGGPNAFATGVPVKFSPDKTQNYEIGVKGSFLENRLSIDASLFYIDWSNLQVTLFTPDFLGYVVNGSAAKSEGVELSAEARPLTGLTLSGWVNYSNAVVTQDFPAGGAHGVSGDRLPNTPRHSGYLSLEQEFPLAGSASGFVGASVNYVGERIGLFTGSSVRQMYPSYTRTDLRAGLRYDSWTASVYVNNLADTRGLTSGGLGYVYEKAFAYIQPRTIGLNVSRTF